MADERSVSVVTFLNTGLRNRQKIETLMAMTQIRAHYRGEVKVCHLFDPYHYCTDR